MLVPKKPDTQDLASKNTMIPTVPKCIYRIVYLLYFRYKYLPYAPYLVYPYEPLPYRSTPKWNAWHMPHSLPTCCSHWRCHKSLRVPRAPASARARWRAWLHAPVPLTRTVPETGAGRSEASECHDEYRQGRTDCRCNSDFCRSTGHFVVVVLQLLQ